MTGKKLSIIIPCYNCVKTLREAVDSCYVQDLNLSDFEIIMVDDGSTDETKAIMQDIKTEHPNIKLIFHEENRGGGAARNTGIKEAQGEIIYCLDSDNFFVPNSVKPMLTHLEKTGVDGVAFYERRFFIGTNTKKYHPHRNSIDARKISLFDILNGSGILLDNFFYTKEAYLRTTGYPEHHGFDTQCFEIRFLSVGNTVNVCPDSYFWHRQASGEKSYFERVYESGEYSLNMYYILEDIMHLLSDSARELIFNYDVFGQNKLGVKNVLGSLSEKYSQDELGLFRHDYQQYLKKNGFETYNTQFGENDILINALWLYRKKRYIEASSQFINLFSKYPKSKILYFNIIRCAVGKDDIENPNEIEKEAIKLISSFSLTKQKIDLNPNIFKRLAYKLIKLVR